MIEGKENTNPNVSPVSGVMVKEATPVKTVKTNVVYSLEDKVLQHINIDKNVVLRVIENANGKFIDIRRFYKDYPTKKGIRFSYSVFEKLKSLVD